MVGHGVRVCGQLVEGRRLDRVSPGGGAGSPDAGWTGREELGFDAGGRPPTGTLGARAGPAPGRLLSNPVSPTKECGSDSMNKLTKSEPRPFIVHDFCRIQPDFECLRASSRNALIFTEKLDDAPRRVRPVATGGPWQRVAAPRE